MEKLMKRLGLTEKESTVFLTLVRMGAQPVSVIARHAGLPRSSLYFTLDSLKEKRLIEEFERRNIIFAKAIPVCDIEEVLRNREREIEKTRSVYRDVLPELTALEQTMSLTPTVKFHEGRDAVASVYRSVIREEKMFSALFNASHVKTYHPKLHFELPKILDGRKGVARELVVDNCDGHEYRDLFLKKSHQIAVLPESKVLDVDIIIHFRRNKYRGKRSMPPVAGIKR